MTYREFIIPDEDAVLETLGVEAEPVEGETAVYRLRFDDGDTQATIVYDMLGRSVNLQLNRGDVKLAGLFREGATRLTPEWRDKQGFVHVDFDTDELGGKLTLQVHPAISLTDSMLLT